MVLHDPRNHHNSAHLLEHFDRDHLEHVRENHCPQKYFRPDAEDREARRLNYVGQTQIKDDQI